VKGTGIENWSTPLDHATASSKALDRQRSIPLCHDKAATVVELTLCQQQICAGKQFTFTCLLTEAYTTCIRPDNARFAGRLRLHHDRRCCLGGHIRSRKFSDYTPVRFLQRTSSWTMLLYRDTGENWESDAQLLTKPLAFKQWIAFLHTFTVVEHA